MTRWEAPVASAPVIGRVPVPGSKSASARALVLAALADGTSTLDGVLDARDPRLMRGALGSLGVDLQPEGEGRWRITPPHVFTGGPIECGLAGTVMRFVPPLAALARGTSTFTGDAEATARPVAPLLDGLRQAGASIEGSVLPFTVHGSGSVRGGMVEVDASGSSQFISALLIAGCRFDDGVTIRHTGERAVPSRPYLDMTAGMLRERGVVIVEPDERTWQVAPGTLAAKDATIEPDLINAAVFLAAGLVTGGRVEVPWPAATLQPADDILAALEAFGGVVERGDGWVALSGTGVRAADVDLTRAAELTCVLASVACLADGPSRLRGVGHIRLHETDRLAALEAELSAQGARVQQTDDGLTITPGPLKGTGFRSYADHRMVHAGAVLGLAVPGVVVDDVDAASKTMPTFAALWASLVGA